MKNTIDLMREMDFAAPADDELIIRTECEMGVEFPEQYKEFMKITNGAEGALGENSYLAIWSLDEIASLNEDYGVRKFTPGLVYFGSDGGGNAYAFDYRGATPVIVEFPFDSIHIEDAVKIADTLEAFISELNKK